MITRTAVAKLKSAWGFVKSRVRRRVDAWAYAGWVPERWARQRIAGFWEDQAEYIHNRWGAGAWDYAALGQIIEKHQVRSVLDVGCGSGRLFPLYAQHGLDVLGVDISEEALAIARKTHPRIRTRCGRIQECVGANEVFDLVVSNRVLQHVPRHEIGSVVEQLSSVARLIYVNELSASEDTAEDYFMVKHDYERLFAAHNWRVAETGTIDDQAYLVLAPIPETAAASTAR